MYNQAPLEKQGELRSQSREKLLRPMQNVNLGITYTTETHEAYNFSFLTLASNLMNVFPHESKSNLASRGWWTTPCHASMDSTSMNLCL